jgi:hypothetical protein
MTANQNAAGPEGPKSPWPGYVQFLFIVALAVMFFLLAQSMMRHHFFSGGRYNNRHSATTPSQW